MIIHTKQFKHLGLPSNVKVSLASWGKLVEPNQSARPDRNLSIFEKECEKSQTFFDVATWVLERLGPMTAWKLRKLAHYSQAWSLFRDDDAVFPEGIKAWVNGSIVRALYNVHASQY